MKFENMYSTTAEKARAQAEEVLKGAKKGVLKASDVVDAGKKPVAKLTKASLKVSSLSHQTTDKLLKNNAKILESELDAVSDYFADLSKVTSLRDFARHQVQVLPKFTRRTLNNGRDTLAIIRDAGQDVRGLVSETVTSIRSKPVAKKAKKVAKKATSKARKTAKKATAKVSKSASTVARKAKAAKAA
ncbi:MAG: phasin family protein [Pseudomonadota bacterium]